LAGATTAPTSIPPRPRPGPRSSWGRARTAARVASAGTVPAATTGGDPGTGCACAGVPTSSHSGNRSVGGSGGDRRARKETAMSDPQEGTVEGIARGAQGQVGPVEMAGQLVEAVIRRQRLVHPLESGRAS